MRLGGPTRVVLAIAVGCLSIGAVVDPAAAATNPPVGHVRSAVQDTFLHRLHVRGWAYDPAHPRESVIVRLWVNGTIIATVAADRPSPVVDSNLHLSGNHAYSVTVPRTTLAHTVTATTRGVVTGAPRTTVGTRAVTAYYPAPGARIIDIAKRYVGDRYVEDGASPAGFDCSGYTMYAYEHARVKQLAHNAESQFLSMRKITRRTARPGDLVFYMSGGSAYHVAIYAGHGWQYAAATPKDGVRYQQVWSPYVRYGTDWH